MLCWICKCNQYASCRFCKEKDQIKRQRLKSIIGDEKRCISCNFMKSISNFRPLPRLARNNSTLILSEWTNQFLQQVSTKPLCSPCYIQWNKTNLNYSVLISTYRRYDQYKETIKDLLTERIHEFLISLNSRCRELFNEMEWRSVSDLI